MEPGNKVGDKVQKLTQAHPTLEISVVRLTTFTQNTFMFLEKHCKIPLKHLTLLKPSVITCGSVRATSS